MQTSKQYIVQYFKTIPVNYGNAVFTEFLVKIKDLRINQDKALKHRDRKTSSFKTLPWFIWLNGNQMVLHNLQETFLNTAL